MLNSSTVKHLEHALNYRSANHKAIANNIANADTPNYKAKTVQFRDALNDSMKAYQTDPKHIPFSTHSGSSYRIMTNQSTAYSHNGNNVDVDREMANLAKNQLHYQALIQRISGKFNSMKMVIKGGR